MENKKLTLSKNSAGMYCCIVYVIVTVGILWGTAVLSPSYLFLLNPVKEL